MRFRIRIEQHHAEPILHRRWNDHRKGVVPDLDQSMRQPDSAQIRKGVDIVPIGTQTLRYGGAESARPRIEAQSLVTLQGLDGRQGAQLAKPFPRARRQFEPGRIGAVDDIHVMVSGKDQDALGETGVSRDGVEEFGPFRGSSRIRHIARDQNEIQGLIVVEGFQPIEDPTHSLVALRPCPSAFDPEPVPLPDHVKVGKMCNAPCARPGRDLVESHEIGRPAHRAVRQRPDERGDHDIAPDDDDGICQDRNNQVERRHQVCRVADPA